MDNFKLYIKRDDKFILYGCGDIKYIMELLNDYLVINDVYGHKEKEFKIERIPLWQNF